MSKTTDPVELQKEFTLKLNSDGEPTVINFHRNLNFDIINYIQTLKGEILTFTDALYSDPIQRKAVADTVKALFRHTLSNLDDRLCSNLCESKELIGMERGFEGSFLKKNRFDGMPGGISHTDLEEALY